MSIHILYNKYNKRATGNRGRVQKMKKIAGYEYNGTFINDCDPLLSNKFTVDVNGEDVEFFPVSPVTCYHWQSKNRIFYCNAVTARKVYGTETDVSVWSVKFYMEDDFSLTPISADTNGEVCKVFFE